MIRFALTSVGSPWAFELRPGLNKLGRNPTNDFRVSDPSVSSFHAEIALNGDMLSVRDLGSTNGTYVDGQKVGEAEMRPGSSLRLGNVEFKFEEVTVIDKVPAKAPPVEVSPEEKTCAYHPGTMAAYTCENCGGCFCDECVKIVGHDRLGTMTVCPVCNGQCNHLPQARQEPGKQPLLARLTQTLKLPFAR